MEIWGTPTHMFITILELRLYHFEIISIAIIGNHYYLVELLLVFDGEH